MNFHMFCIFHKEYYLREDNENFIFFGVNEIYPKSNIGIKGESIILEHELEKYNPFLQKRGYMETSAYLHVYWNKLYLNNEIVGNKMVGFSQYDMKHNDNYSELDNDTIYLLNTGACIVNNKEWNNLMFPEFRNLDFLISSYNRFFNKNYSINELESMPLSLWQTNIYPVSIYEKLCQWLEVLVDEIYPWSNELPYETHFGSIGGYTERAISIFNAFEIYQGIKYKNLNIEHGVGALEKEQYNKNSFINSYSQDIYTKYIDNITGNYEGIQFSMFKSQCYLDNICYSCERVNKDGKNGLYFIKDKEINEYAFDIEGEDPRIFIFMGHVYVIFICLSPYENQNRCIGITKFDEWNPIFLQIDGMQKSHIEKNWVPFIKEGRLYFIYNYDPLIVLEYDLNLDGICKVIFGNLPIDTSITYLRGGCHSRIYKNCYEHYTHIILLDTNKWELVYVSKPVMYLCQINNCLNSHWLSPNSEKKLDTFYNILLDRTPNIIQDPISIYEKNSRYYITINIRDSVTLLYEIKFSNLFNLIKRDCPIGYFDNDVKNMILSI